jgi:glycerol-3-phosphate dehydrogenase
MEVDLLIIGGGINGCGIAADAAAKGLSVVLCEKDDLAYGTSSYSSKLIHGGLRYLEQYQFHLVYASLKEREILMRKSPHLIEPIEFILPHDAHYRPSWLIQLGLIFYDYLYWAKTIPRSKKLNLNKHSKENPLKPKYSIGFSYFDCKTDDARLVIANAMAAKKKGAKILTRTQYQSAKRQDNHWLIDLHDKTNNQKFTIKSKAIVNAGGPWVSDIIDTTEVKTDNQVTLVKGSHIVIKKLYDGEHAYTLQNIDQRVVFTLPYQDHFTLIGTTEVGFSADANHASINQEEIDYLCNTINHYFNRSISSKDIVWSFSGVRPLHDDHSDNLSNITRESYIDVNDKNQQLPFLSIFGGKITTYRILADNVLKKLRPYFPKMNQSTTKNTVLPGGHCDGLPFVQFIHKLKRQYHWLPKEIIMRYARSYGDLSHRILKNCQGLSDLGRHFGAGLYEKEITYLRQSEWAINADDIIWRRSKLGLHLIQTEINSLENYLNEHHHSSND